MTARGREPQVSLKYFDCVAVVFVAVLLISNIAAQKLFAAGPFVFTAGILVFPIAYIFGDVLTEVYGYQRARRVIWMGLLCNVLLVVVLQISIALPPADGWPLQEQFAAVLGYVPRIVVASVVAYWAGELSNSYVLAKMKVATGGAHLWARTIGSTVVGQAVDTTVFLAIGFWGTLPLKVLITALWSGYLFKVLYEVVATPATYAIVRWLKAREQVDVFDRSTHFTPFSLRVDSHE